MNWKRVQSALRAALKPGLAVLFTALIVWLAVFAPTSAFHTAVHSDGADAHQCAICHFTKSQVLTAGAPSLLAGIVLLVFAGAFPALQVFLSSVDLRLAPGRAPPRFSRASLR
ncbi:MAG: hypothetical protein HY300_07355 [Verrucomicrobia bacterium]|nr:hypothetical protein [Verrucomicrobiota bacterium]